MVARSGGRILVDQLRIHGTQHVYGVPGESYLALLDALHDVPELCLLYTSDAADD